MCVNGSEDEVNMNIKIVRVGLRVGGGLLSFMLFVLVTLKFVDNNGLVVLDFVWSCTSQYNPYTVMDMELTLHLVRFVALSDKDIVFTHPFFQC
jgi:hypothetical protein